MTGRNVTDQRASAAALGESERRFRSAFDHAPIGMAIQSIDGRWLQVNRALCEMLGYAESDLLGRQFRELTHPDDVGEDLEALRRLADGEETRIAREKRYIHRDGRSVWMLVHASSVRDETGSLLYLITQYQDLTQQKRAEQQLLQAQKMEAVGLLAGGVAHDFNNIVTAITGYSELLLAGLAPDDPRREYPEQIRKAGDRAASLTRQLLAFSRRQVLEPRVLDLNDVVSGIRSMLQRLIGENIEVSPVPSPDLWHVRADPTQIEQAVMNLVLNARDAMAGGGTLTIATRNVVIDAHGAPQDVPMPPGEYVALGIADTGVGMSRQVRARLFEPFFTTKQRGQGTGLGLSTTYGIVKQSGGFISCESQQGRGTTFEIFLPRVTEEIEKIAPAAPAPARAPGRERVLLVEDEPEVRALLQKVLTMLGYDVLAAPGPREALQLVSGFDGDIPLMVTDVVMPGMSGRELAVKLAAARPNIKVLFVSGYTDEAIARHGILERGTAFLQKPFSPQILAEKVRELLGGANPNIKAT